LHILSSIQRFPRWLYSNTKASQSLFWTFRFPVTPPPSLLHKFPEHLATSRTLCCVGANEALPEPFSTTQSALLPASLHQPSSNNRKPNTATTQLLVATIFSVDSHFTNFETSRSHRIPHFNFCTPQALHPTPWYATSSGLKLEQDIKCQQCLKPQSGQGFNG